MGEGGCPPGYVMGGVGDSMLNKNESGYLVDQEQLVDKTFALFGIFHTMHSADSIKP